MGALAHGRLPRLRPRPRPPSLPGRLGFGSAPRCGPSVCSPGARLGFVVRLPPPHPHHPLRPQHHLSRVTAPFRAIHRVYIPIPAVSLLSCSPFAQLRQQVLIPSVHLFSFCSVFAIDSSRPNPHPLWLFSRCYGSEFLNKQVNLVLPIAPPSILFIL